MNEKTAQLLLDELFPALEMLETQSAAILQFLRDKGIASDEELTSFLDQAAKASNVRWRAARVRMDRQLSSATKAEESTEQKPLETAQKNPPRTPETASTAGREGEANKNDEGGKTAASHESRQHEPDHERTPETTSAPRRDVETNKLDEGRKAAASHERKQNDPDHETAGSEQPAGKDAA
jgi:hypothetical protein